MNIKPSIILLILILYCVLHLIWQLNWTVTDRLAHDKSGLCSSQNKLDLLCKVNIPVCCILLRLNIPLLWLGMGCLPHYKYKKLLPLHFIHTAVLTLWLFISRWVMEHAQIEGASIWWLVSARLPWQDRPAVTLIKWSMPLLFRQTIVFCDRLALIKMDIQSRQRTW